MNTDDLDFFEAPAEEASEAFKNKVTGMVREHRQLEQRVTDLNDQIGKLKKRIMELETRDIPDALAQAGLREFTTLEGLKVSTKFVVGGIPAERKEEAFEWLDQHGASSIIKRGVAVKFDKGSEQAAEQAAQQLRQLGLDPKLTLEIHPQTWMSFAREQIGKGVLLPLNEWGVFHGEKAVIK